MKNSDFSTISDILKESVLKANFGQALDKCMLFGFWKNVVGKKFANFSLCYDLKGTTLYVSVSNPAIIQELSFFKADIIKKFEPYADGLNLKIKDIRFDYKNWHHLKNLLNADNLETAFDIDVPDIYTQKDYDSIGLDNIEEQEFNKLKEIVDNIEFLTDELKQKLYNNALNKYKAKKLRSE